VKILVNSLGCPVCRPAFREDLVSFIKDVADDLCTNCVRRIETNPMRVLDCKVPSCKEALEGSPVILEYLCPECDDHFSRVTGGLTGLGVPYEVDPRIVRGLDYYNRTAFEAVCDRLGAQNAVAAGGRYDGLAREIGGDASGIGFAIGLERLTMVMDWDNIALPVVDYYIAAVTETARIPVMGLADSLRRKGYSVETDLEDRSLKAQLRSANRTGTSRVLIIGDDELTDGTLQVKDFSTGDQETVDMESFLKKLKVRQ
ncbi:histidine--tRNA ligase, partial [bacterium]|nr:histidine--tRNA ligase [bacterium]